MVSFAIIEVDVGLTVATIEGGQSAEEAARARWGVLVDPAPYTTYEDACDALCELEFEDEERRD